MELLVAKFGGSSLANAQQFRKVEAIIRADARRRFVVPSAPGKRSSDDIKVTDLLYACYNRASGGDFPTEEFELIKNRYREIIRELGLSVSLEAEFEAIEEHLRTAPDSDYIASRGEYLNGILLADLLGYTFIDAAEVIFFDQRGRYDDVRTNKVLSARLKTLENAVIPGFYGSDYKGQVKTFSRGGSDITGSIVARAADPTFTKTLPTSPAF